jgi:alkylhydroperoxidase family enzyme
LRRAGASEDLIAAIREGEEPESVPGRLRSLLYFARKITLLPNSLSRRDVEDLRAVGLTDFEILHAVQIAAYYNLATRLAMALGVDIEPD